MSVSAFVRGCDKEKFIGPIGLNQSNPIPIELLTLLSFKLEL